MDPIIQEFEDHRADYKELPYKEFRKLYDDNQFIDGPWMDSFGSGYGEPHNPHRDGWGTLKDGRKVRTVT